MSESTITKEELLEFGMKEDSNDPLFPLSKDISKADISEELNPMSICITGMRNVNELCLMLPDGCCLYLSIGNIEDLKTFEKSIQSWEANY